MTNHHVSRGGYVSGSVSGFLGTDIYDGNDLIRESGGNVVVVAIQYRLGLFGFLAGQDVKNALHKRRALYVVLFAFLERSKFHGTYLTWFSGSTVCSDMGPKPRMNPTQSSESHTANIQS